MVRSTVYTDTWAVANGLADGQGLRKNRIVILVMRKSGEGWDQYRLRTYLCHIGKFSKGHDERDSLNHASKVACPVYLSILLQSPRDYTVSFCTK